MALKINDNGVTRDMTADEQAAYKAFQTDTAAETEAQNKALVAKKAAQKAVLDKLGLTADEASALLG